MLGAGLRGGAQRPQAECERNLMASILSVLLGDFYQHEHAVSRPISLLPWATNSWKEVSAPTVSIPGLPVLLN